VKRWSRCSMRKANLELSIAPRSCRRAARSARLLPTNGNKLSSHRALPAITDRRSRIGLRKTPGPGCGKSVRGRRSSDSRCGDDAHAWRGANFAAAFDFGHHRIHLSADRRTARRRPRFRGDEHGEKRGASRQQSDGPPGYPRNSWQFSRRQPPLENPAGSRTARSAVRSLCCRIVISSARRLGSSRLCRPSWPCRSSRLSLRPLSRSWCT
jgi:hypothetical protein